MRIALVWSSHRNDAMYSTHHSFWEETLKEYPNCTVDRYTWSDFATMPLGYDLYLFLDFHPSLYQLDKLNFHPRAFFWWDSFHHPFSYVAQVTELFDMSYFAEYQSANYLSNQGYRVQWLPPAFYPKLYRPIEADSLYQYAFVGQLDNVIVRKGLTRLDFVKNVISECNKTHMAGYVGSGVFGEDVNLIYNQTKILFDRTIFNNLGTRFFETIGGGNFTLVNKHCANGMDLMGQDGVHFVTYNDSFPDFWHKFSYYSKHPEEAEDIAKTGREYFLKHHTYKHRLEKILLDFKLI